MSTALNPAQPSDTMSANSSGGNCYSDALPAGSVCMRQDLEQPSDQRHITYRYLNLEIDPGVPAITRAGQAIELRAKALTLLMFLVDQRHRIVSKEEIFDRVWPNTAVMDATLAGCIQEIRRALGDDAKHPLIIRTVPKLGYRFVAPVNERPSAGLRSPGLRSPGEHPVEAMIPSAPARRGNSRWIVAAAMSMAMAAVVVIFMLRRTPVDDFGEAAWWKFDEGGGSAIADSSGHHLNGTVLGGSWTSGVRGGALRFEETGHRVSGVDTLQILPRADMPRTLAAWVKTDTASGDINGILHFGDPPGPASFDAPQLMLLPDGRPAFANQGYAGIRGDQSLAVAEHSIADGRWHHVAGTLSGGRGVLYVDGTPSAATYMRTAAKPAAGMTLWARGTPWAIGNYVNQARSGFRGSLDDVRVWRRTLRPSELAALYRCTAGVTDLATPNGPYFFSPIFDSPAQEQARVDIADGQLIHQGFDYGGIQLAAQSADCPVAGLRGANLGQDLAIAVELLVPRSPTGDIVQAGPYFRSRAAAPGDGILGGASAGYWVQLHSNGKVSVKCLNPVHTVALTQPIEGFDSRVFHRLEVVVHGEELEASLDGRPLMFHQGDHPTRIVQVQAHWERPAQIGKNHGTVGIAFSSEPLRPKAGGQQARAFTVLPYPLPYRGGTAQR